MGKQLKMKRSIRIREKKKIRGIMESYGKESAWRRIRKEKSYQIERT